MMEAKGRLKEASAKILRLHKEASIVDSKIPRMLVSHEQRMSRLLGIIDTMHASSYTGRREQAHRQGRLRSSDNPIDSELEGLRGYVDILEEAHHIMHAYLHEINSLIIFLKDFRNSLSHHYGKTIASSALADIETLLDQLRMENHAVRDEEFQIHNLTETIKAARVLISRIFAYDDENSIRDNRKPSSMMRNALLDANIKITGIARRVESHNGMILPHMKHVYLEILRIIQDYNKILEYERAHKDAVRRAA